MSPYGPASLCGLLALGLVAGSALPLTAKAPVSKDNHGIDLVGIDRKVAPGDDFFAHANGAWIQRTNIPADRSAYGTSAMVADLTERRTAALIKGLIAKPALAGSEAQKIRDTYTSYMDEAAIEALGLKPLQPTLDQIAAIADRKALATSLGATLRADVDALNATNFTTDNLFGLWVAQDLDVPTRYAAFLLQGGLGMPDRDYYLDPAPRMAEVRSAYQAHIAKVLGLANFPDAEARAAKVFALERRIAEGHWSREASADVVKGNNAWARKDFESKAPGLDWTAYFEAAGLGAQQDFKVWQPSAFTTTAALASSESLETWKDYLRFHAIDHRSAFLPKAFVEARFDFYGKVLSGTPKMRDRWKRGISLTSEALGEAVGKLYVQHHFPASEKARAEAMVQNILVAFGKRIDQLAWMAPETKTKAKAKLATLKVAVGYPNRWRDYSTLEIRKGDALGNVDRAELFELKRNLQKLGQPIDRDEWVMTPQTVNAVNLPVMNAMNFPAAILQAPDFDAKRTLAMNYGAIGATIGHEISHSFDDQGALFDATGKLSNWWTDADLAHFTASAAQLVTQFDAYRPFPDLAVNGKLTLSENIADVAGLAAAYDAYRVALGGKLAPVVQGLSGDQQFFLAYAQSWREKRREASRRQQIIGDSHAPAEYRADGVRNHDAWYEAFAVKPEHKLYLAPKDRVKVW